VSDALRALLLETLRLKDVPRAGWLRIGVRAPESVAAHSWGVAFLALVLCPAGLDRGRALAIALAHDLAEVRVGDITPHDGVPKAEKHRREAEALRAMLAPVPNGDELAALWAEYAAGATREARFVRACDKLDLALQSRHYAEAQGIDTGELLRSALAALDDEALRDLAGAV
jgi:putative hydrolase of HD superfamily